MPECKATAFMRAIWIVASLLPALPVQAQHEQMPVPLMHIDAGPVTPVDPYYSHLLSGDDQDGVLPGIRFPLTSPLTAGQLTRAGAQVLHPRWLTHPVFIAGADEFSLSWLKRHQHALAAMHATGVIVSAASEQSFKAMQRAADGLPLSVALDGWLVQRLLAAEVGVLPVLIGVDGRAVQDLSGAAP